MHWEILLRSRAIENQVVIVASAQTGKHNELRESYGHSMIIDAWGKVKVDISEEKTNTYSYFDIDLDEIQEVRKQITCFDHKRNDVY